MSGSVAIDASRSSVEGAQRRGGSRAVHAWRHPGPESRRAARSAALEGSPAGAGSSENGLAAPFRPAIARSPCKQAARARRLVRVGPTMWEGEPAEVTGGMPSSRNNGDPGRIPICSYSPVKVSWATSDSGIMGSPAGAESNEDEGVGRFEPLCFSSSDRRRARGVRQRPQGACLHLVASTARPTASTPDGPSRA